MKRGVEEMGKPVNNLMSHKDYQEPNPKKRHKDKVKNIQFIPQDYERIHMRQLVSVSKKSPYREQWKTITDIAEEFVRLSLSRGKTILNGIKPARDYLTKGKRVNVWLTPDEWEQIEQLAIQHDVSVKHMAYSLFNYGHMFKKEEERNETLSAWIDTERNEDCYRASDVLL